MLTVDYRFYRDTFRGVLTEEEFDRLSVFASAYMDELTMGRITDGLSEAAQRSVKLAFCAVCDARAVGERRDGIASESNDGVSVSYAADAAAAAGLYAAAAPYLAPTGLLYRGVGS